MSSLNGIFFAQAIRQFFTRSNIGNAFLGMFDKEGIQHENRSNC